MNYVIQLFLKSNYRDNRDSWNYYRDIGFFVTAQA